MKATLFQVSVSVALALIAGSSCLARTLFETEFDDPPLHPGLEDVDAAFILPGGVIRREFTAHDSDRHYIRTVDSDYFVSGPFAFEVSFENPLGGNFGTIQYIGLGNGIPNPGYFNEPGPPSNSPGTGTGSVNLRIHSPDLVDGRIDWAFNLGVPGEEILAEAIGFLQTVGLHRARIRASNDQLEMSIDEDFTGVFTPTISTTIDLTAYPQIKAVLLNESHAFFGTAQSTINYDDFAIVPEPASGLALLVGAYGLSIWRRR